jgi:hypothetical protein
MVADTRSAVAKRNHDVVDHGLPLLVRSISDERVAGGARSARRAVACRLAGRRRSGCEQAPRAASAITADNSMLARADEQGSQRGRRRRTISNV